MVVTFSYTFQPYFLLPHFLSTTHKVPEPVCGLYPHSYHATCSTILGWLALKHHPFNGIQHLQDRLTTHPFCPTMPTTTTTTSMCMPAIISWWLLAICQCPYFVVGLKFISPFTLCLFFIFLFCPFITFLHPTTTNSISTILACIHGILSYGSTVRDLLLQ